MHILYVDDDKTQRLIFEHDFSHSQYKVEAVESAIDAMVKIKSNGFDLVICDVLMPLDDGLTFAKELAASNLTIPLILTSAALNLHQLSNYKGLKNYLGFILKPVKPEKVENLINGVVDD